MLSRGMPARNAASANRTGRRSLIVHLFRTITWPHWALHRLRTALTIIGISLGVATVIGMANVSKSVLASFRHMVRTVAGASDLEITSPGGDVDDAVVGRTAEVPGVKDAAGLNERFISLPDYSSDSLCLFGLDFLGSPIWRDQIPRDAVIIPDQTEFIVEPDSVMLTEQFMARVKISLGSTLRVLTPDGIRILRVRGILKDAPIAMLFDGMVAIMDLPAAQRLLGREGRVDRVAVRVVPGAAVPDVRARLATMFGPAIEVAAAEARGRECERLLFSLRGMLFTMSSLAVMVGAFIVYHTVAVSVQQRRRQFALLNTIGIHRHSIVGLCLAETLILAMFGVTLGFLSGELIGALASGFVGDAASQIWVQLTVDRHAHSLPGVLLAAVIGVATALLAAYIALRATFGATTVEALRPVNVEIEPVRGVAWLIGVGLALPASSWLLAFAPQELGFAPLIGLLIATHAVAYAGGAVLAPVLVLFLASVLRRFVRKSRSLPFRLAVDNLPRSPWRTGSTVATIIAALGMAVAVAGGVRSFEAAVVRWVERHFCADLFVGGGAQFRLLAGPPMSEEVGELIARTSGVADVEPFRVMRIRLHDQPVFLQGISLNQRLAHGGVPMRDGGSFEAAVPGLREGRGALLSDNLALRLGLHVGDTVEVPTPSGRRSFRILGTFVNYLGSLDLGAVAVSRVQLNAIWGDRRANLFRVWLDPGATPSTVRREILERLGGGYYVITAGQFLESVRSVLRRFFLATWALQLVAALVGVIGVVNAQLASVVDRREEIGMIRTIGVPARAIVRSVILECGAIGALGGLSGALLGVVLGAQAIEVGLRLATGWRMPFELPLASVASSVVIAILISAIAGYIPARTAARMTVRQQSLD